MPRPSTSDPNFDPAAGSTIHVGIDPDEAFVPDVTAHMKESAYLALMTPQGDPFDPACIWGAPTLYWGLPAVAKSDMVEQAAYEANMASATIYPGQRQPEDFSGVLVPSPTGIVLECILGAVRFLNGQKRGVIFLDEMNGATRATHGAMLGFIQKRIVGDSPLEPGVRILAASNPPKWSTSGMSLPSATANRLVHLQVKCPPVRNWIHHMISEGVKPKFDSAGAEDLVRAKWGSTYSHAKALLVGYMQSRPNMLHIHPNIDSPQAGFGWASPRSWKQAARIKATADALGYAEVLTLLMIEGCVGEAAAFDFYNWMRKAELPKPEEVLQTNWIPDPRRLDIAFAVLASVTQYVTTARDRAEAINLAVPAWRLLNNYKSLNMGDMVVSSAKALVDKNLGRKAHPTIKVVADPIIDYLTDNNLLRYVAD